jgi:hypothetical protein
MKQELHPVCLACTGNSSGQSLYRLEMCRKEKALARIERALMHSGFAN